MITIFKGITFNPATNKIAGSLDDYILMNETNSGTTTNIKGASFAIKMYLLKKGKVETRYWGLTRLQFITKNVFKIKSNPAYEVII
jgi:hypothetical protein